jgi:hypothetical protein
MIDLIPPRCVPLCATLPVARERFRYPKEQTNHLRLLGVLFRPDSGRVSTELDGWSTVASERSRLTSQHQSLKRGPRFSLAAVRCATEEQLIRGLRHTTSQLDQPPQIEQRSPLPAADNERIGPGEQRKCVMRRTRSPRRICGRE